MGVFRGGWGNLNACRGDKRVTQRGENGCQTDRMRD